MRRRFYVLGLCTFLVSGSSLAETTAAVDVVLNPAGSFRAETKKVTGYAYKTKDGVAAENIKVDLRTLTTGVSLRDQHTKKRLHTDKHPFAKLVKATGKGGIGKGIVEIKGMRREVTGTYKIVGKELQAEFPLTLTELQITDANYMGVGVDDKMVLKVNVPLKDRAPASAGKATKKPKAKK
ncbi:MAG: YceI family protein [Bdellovibrionales bacterium]